MFVWAVCVCVCVCVRVCVRACMLKSSVREQRPTCVNLIGHVVNIDCHCRNILCFHAVRKECLAHRAYNRFRTAFELLECTGEDDNVDEVDNFRFDT